MATLRDYRKQKGQHLKTVAAAVDVDESSLSRIERGQQYPSRTTAAKLAAFYQVSIGDIFNAIPEAKTAV